MIEFPEGKFDVILADPPWKFKTYSAKGRGRCPDGDVGRFHYPTMKLEEIKALPVREIAAKNCVLYLWGTAPMLPEALEVIAAWGFKYKTSAVWVKHRIATGYWLRNKHEILTISTRGGGLCPKRGKAVESVITEDRRLHSQKPERSYEIIEQYHPDLKKVELFARTVRPGWEQWGNQLGEV